MKLFHVIRLSTMGVYFIRCCSHFNVSVPLVHIYEILSSILNGGSFFFCIIQGLSQYVHFDIILQYTEKLIPTLQELSLNSRRISLKYVLCAKKYYLGSNRV